MGSRQENKSRQHRGNGGRLAPCSSKHKENAIWKIPMGERAGQRTSVLSMAVLRSSFPATSWRITLARSSSAAWFRFAPFSPMLLLTHCSLCLATSTKLPYDLFFFFYHLVHNKLLVTTEGLWHLLHGQGLSKRCKNAITQPTTVLLPEQAQPSPRGLASQDFICIIFHLKPAVTLILTLAERSAALCALMHCQGW